MTLDTPLDTYLPIYTCMYDLHSISNIYTYASIIDNTPHCLSRTSCAIFHLSTDVYTLSISLPICVRDILERRALFRVVYLF
jgi:hypothetical protein